MKYKQYERAGIYMPEEVLPYVVPIAITRRLRKKGLGKSSPEWKTITQRTFDGHLVRMTSSRYRMFKNKGMTCVTCGFEGTYFALEKHKGAKHNKFHFNCYGIDEDGNERMITKDHIIPRSLGGPDHPNNYQPMCDRCNAEKENEYYTVDPTRIMDDVDRLFHGDDAQIDSTTEKDRQLYRIASFLLRVDRM
jgi:hypothetical protein